MSHQTVFVVDFGGQYTQLIVRRVRELNVYSEMVPWTEAERRIREDGPSAVILSGGPRSVLAEGAPTMDFGVLDGTPTLGICYGLQLMAHKLGGTVVKSPAREYGRRKLIKVSKQSIVGGLTSDTVWMSHGDQVTSMPTGYDIIASTESCPVAGFAHAEARRYGVQFHPEVSHTPGGKTVLERFLFDAAKLRGDWTSENFVEEETTRIRARVGNRKVLCAVSGGVDSMVMAALLNEAIGERAVCVFVDHGLLRKNEADQVRRAFEEQLKRDLIVFDERDAFFGALAGITDPERKRKVIGNKFVEVFERHANELKECDFLAQGTLYPDVIESGSATASKIKTHHNVGGLPENMAMELIEPLRWLFKDEVRRVGLTLNLEQEVVFREPFPGPGLAVRILGEVTPERVHIVQEADWIFREELLKEGLQHGIWQSYAAMLDVRSVGVMGDERTYEHPIVLRAVESEDAMTAKAVNIPFDVLEHIATRIVNEVDGVNRVFYDLTSKPPATIELE